MPYIFIVFMVTNCSKEQLGSIVTKTLKNGILIPIVTSKEFYFNADFKYISLIKFSPTHQKVASLRKFVREPQCKSFKHLSTKMWNFVFLPEERSCMRVFFFFLPGVNVSTQLS